MTTTTKPAGSRLDAYLARPGNAEKVLASSTAWLAAHPDPATSLQHGVPLPALALEPEVEAQITGSLSRAMGAKKAAEYIAKNRAQLISKWRGMMLDRNLRR